ncbi:MAG: class I SAM-dependent methyltransferase [Rickettsia endosymbiont of Ecitomorpha arachnoides]|nr:class I SAM-dependent methyltransferase [Rickettsia endosymbiont of Sceptobius lativentris]MCC8462008.1 class I SAM-dependent methyltransferase [Rickettsia endosymbiont of Ecitomorpha arachnoides]
MKNIQYYDNNAQLFYDRTINADLSDNYKEFISYLPKQAHILDAGCGVGRDSKYFLSQGYQGHCF